LRKIQAFGDLLQARFGASIGADGCDYVDRMQAAAARMKRMIDDLLRYSRIGTTAQPFQPVDLNHLAQGVLSDLDILIQESGAQIQLEPLPALEADPVQMRHMLLNLVGNALKFRREGVTPHVRISAERISGNDAGEGGAINGGAINGGALDGGPEGASAGPDRVRITVEDNGIGFDERYLERIFQPFQRLHGRSEYDGSGIGLALCRKIAERHGGSLTARSTPGRGSTFYVSVPVHQAQGL
jgi:signal transduction histidine kinase